MGLQVNSSGGHLALRIITKPELSARDHSLTKDAAHRTILPLVEELEKASLPTDEQELKQAINNIRRTVCKWQVKSDPLRRSKSDPLLNVFLLLFIPAVETPIPWLNVVDLKSRAFSQGIGVRLSGN